MLSDPKAPLDAVAQNGAAHVAVKMQSTMALTPTDGTPRVHVNNRNLLHPAGGKRVVKVEPEAGRLDPSPLGIPKEHAQQVTSARLPIGSLVRFAGVHDTQVVDKLDVTLLAIEPGAELLRQVLDSVHGVHLLIGYLGHAWVALDPGASKEGRLYELANRLSSGKEQGGTRFEIRDLIPVACSKGQSASAIVSKTSGSDRNSSL